MEKGDVRSVAVRGSAAGFAQEIHAGPHRLLADEPASAGGTDTGPSPYDLLLAAKDGRSRKLRFICGTRKSTPPIAPNAKPKKECSIESNATFILVGR